VSAEDQQRVSDADREAVAARLRDATAEGRLDPAELDERLTRAYGARTRADLAPLTGDLPGPAPAPPPTPSVWRNEDVRDRLGMFIVANVVCIAVWAASGADGGFWPKWVLLGTGIALLAAVVYGVLGIEDHDERHALRHERRRGLPPDRR
jgi:uncharacterized protein DUF1707